MEGTPTIKYPEISACLCAIFTWAHVGMHVSEVDIRYLPLDFDV